MNRTFSRAGSYPTFKRLAWRHILVDTVCLLLHAKVLPADIQDRDGGVLLLSTLFGLYPFLVKLFADAGYQGPKFATAVAKVLPHLSVEIVKRSDHASGFVVLPMRCIAGPATITPASGYVGPLGAATIGACGGVFCCLVAGWVKEQIRIDDSLDVFGVHGLGGMLGSLLLAAFALPALGGSGYGHSMTVARQLSAQVLGVVAAAVWSALCLCDCESAGCDRRGTCHPRGGAQRPRNDLACRVMNA
jgi:transposase